MKNKRASLIQFIIGIVFVLTAGVAMILNFFEDSARIIIAVIGIIFVATSKFRILK